MTDRIVQIREAAFKDAQSALACRETVEEWRANLPHDWIAALPSRELDAICAYVWGDDWLEKRARRWAEGRIYG